MILCVQKRSLRLARSSGESEEAGKARASATRAVVQLHLLAYAALCDLNTNKSQPESPDYLLEPRVAFLGSLALLVSSSLHVLLSFTLVLTSSPSPPDSVIDTATGTIVSNIVNAHEYVLAPAAVLCGSRSSLSSPLLFSNPQRSHQPSRLPYIDMSGYWRRRWCGKSKHSLPSMSSWGAFFKVGSTRRADPCFVSSSFGTLVSSPSVLQH